MAATVNVLSKSYFLLSLVILFGTANAIRTIQTFLNPGCMKDCEGGVAYIKARGDQDTLHYVVTTIGPPTVLVIMTQNTDNAVHEGISIDWQRLKSDNMTMREKSIILSKDLKVLYTYGVVFTRLFQYNDTSDKANLKSYNVDNTAWNVYDFTNSFFTWEDLSMLSSDYTIILKVLNSTNIKGQRINNGSLQFKFSFFDHMDRAKELPHLQYTENICQLDFILKDIDTGNMSLSRFALEAALFSTDSTNGPMKFEETKSIDDEYTPGVFKISNWLAKSENVEKGGFLQHKPVCYTKPARGRAYATYVRGYPLSPIKDTQFLLDQSAVLSYFGNMTMSTLRMTSTNFSFGLAKDGTFTKTNYSVWTASIGLGKPPNDSVSSLVMAVIFAGLGVPVVLILFGGLFICIKKRTNPKIVDVSKRALIN